MKPQRRKRVAAALWFYYDSGFAARIWGQIGQFVPLIVGVIDFKGRDDWYFQLIEQRGYFLGNTDPGDLNGRPRKILSYRTPEELFESFLDSVSAAGGCGNIARNGSQRLPFRRYISTVQVSNLRLQFPLIIVVIFKNLLVFVQCLQAGWRIIK